MNLLISDYDGTIKTYDNNPNMLEKYTFKKNIEEIKRFIERKNKFIIATGRSTDSIEREIIRYNIPYNYLITYNGRVSLDKDNRLINAEYIDNKFLDELKDINIRNISLFNEYEKTNFNKNLIYIYLSLKNYKDNKKYLTEWTSKYPDLKIDYNILFNYLIIRKKYNKLQGIKDLINKENITIPNNSIITVGDNINDIDMINEYNGYRMFISNPELLFKTNNVTTSVHKLIKKIK